MKIQLYGVLAAATVGFSGLAQGEVITGNYPAEQIEFQFPEHTEYVEGLGLSFHTFASDAGGGSNTTNYQIGGSSDPVQENVRMLTSGNAGVNREWVYFNEGQNLAEYDSARNQIGLASSTYEPEFGTSWSSIGSPDQTLYIGFMVVDSANSFERNYGYIQVVRGNGPLDFNVVGWAFETEAEVNLVVSDLTIPAPASVALLGLAAKGATRRRRS